ncbi:MAG: phosphate/phosphite/phosphonate ABC transporter substrate-binding protein [Phycisphaerales bacterium]|jgi:phosphonate transport system substrate-binding protein|nr:phosphate/phosphite/phosphonate ABC transporter substrate-binding protein [Phycisphaerales bacterium]
MLRFLSILLAVVTFASANEIPLRLDFGVYPSDRATVMYRKFTPILEAIQEPVEQLLGHPVDIHLTIFKNYDAGIDALVHGEVDFVRFGPASYILAEQRNKNITLLAMEQKKGLTRFNGHIITKTDSGIKSLQDLVGRSFAFGDRNSTIGRYLAQAEMLQAGIYEEDLQSFDYLGRHDLVASAVLTGSHDAGAIKGSTYNKLCDPKKIAVLHTFENVTKPWVAREGLQPAVQEAITEALLSLEKSEILGELGCTGFIRTSPKEYDTVRSGMKRSEGFSQKEKPKRSN